MCNASHAWSVNRFLNQYPKRMPPLLDVTTVLYYKQIFHLAVRLCKSTALVSREPRKTISRNTVQCTRQRIITPNISRSSLTISNCYQYNSSFNQRKHRVSLSKRTAPPLAATCWCFLETHRSQGLQNNSIPYTQLYVGMGQFSFHSPNHTTSTDFIG